MPKPVGNDPITASPRDTTGARSNPLDRPTERLDHDASPEDSRPQTSGGPAPQNGGPVAHPGGAVSSSAADRATTPQTPQGQGRPGGDPWGPSIFAPAARPGPAPWPGPPPAPAPVSGAHPAPGANPAPAPAANPAQRPAWPSDSGASWTGAQQRPPGQGAPPPAPPAPGGWGGQPPQPWGGTPVREPKRRSGSGPVLIAVALVASLVGGLLGAWLMRSTGGSGGQPTINQVVASDKSSVDKVEAVAQNLLPVTVQIQVGNGVTGGTGSGVIMTQDGYIVTNNHVVADAERITVVLPSSEAVGARLIGADPANDVAVVKVDKNELPIANFGRSADLKVGELTVAVGSPFGLSGTVTSGVVSALHRVVQIGPDEQLVNAIQTDASINPGNSGGALANGSGQVIGINTAIATNGNEASAGVGFAIPIDEALAIAKDLIAGKPIKTPLLGVKGGADLTPEVAERYGLKGRTGALIREVEPNSAADKAGMRPSDLVVKINGEQVRGWDELVVAVRKVGIGNTVPVVVVRGGRELTLQVTPTEKQP
jgi:putative serine protease PepD